MGVIDPGQLQPRADHVQLVAGLLAEVQDATAVELAAHLALPLTTIAAALRQLERERRAQRTTLGWAHLERLERPQRRPWPSRRPSQRVRAASP